MFNITTVRYPLNLKRVMNGPGAGYPGCVQVMGHNNPLQSPHPGGVLVGFVDGSIRYYLAVVGSNTAWPGVDVRRLDEADPVAAGAGGQYRRFRCSDNGFLTTPLDKYLQLLDATARRRANGIAAILLFSDRTPVWMTEKSRKEKGRNEGRRRHAAAGVFRRRHEPLHERLQTGQRGGSPAGLPFCEAPTILELEFHGDPLFLPSDLES